MNLFLIGMMGSGKTTVGRALAQRLGWRFVDTDRIVEDLEGKPVSEIFAQDGEAYFREREKRAIANLSTQGHSVVSTGGGAPCFEENWNVFRAQGKVLWLKAAPQTLFDRLKQTNAGQRPLLKDGLSAQKLAEMQAQRDPFYRRADFILETDGLSLEACLLKISDYLRSKNILS